MELVVRARNLALWHLMIAVLAVAAYWSSSALALQGQSPGLATFANSKYQTTSEWIENKRSAAKDQWITLTSWQEDIKRTFN